ncbi:c-type cytochrome [Leptolyngbya sp. FACHB-321]|uniref:cytochrome c6 PetJ n=1 Tax=Leptolyngbya sp. FACHB-321 TaxID=2692807 RepID=UPI0016888DBF|nr:c-type cytochrome [Leptolyngbya sp. FACHB-321]MBD2035355.1 c-type cytochrome [Leptolyngbya sp. FACHB-321]
MKKLMSSLLVAIALCLTFFTTPALADAATALTARGAKLFSANCAACHQGGNNVISANKNLKAAALKQYGMDSTEAIIAQVTNGKNAMPAFKGRLKEEDIQAVAAYVLDQSAKDWKK